MTPTAEGKAIVRGSGENYVQSHQNGRNMMIRAVVDSSSPENQTGKPMGLPVASHAKGGSPCGSFSDHQCLNLLSACYRIDRYKTEKIIMGP